MLLSSIPIITIVGPTGIGKTKLSLAIAKSLQGEVISIDSCQVYRDAPIMTGAVTDEEADGIEHHLLKHCGPEEEINPERFTGQVVDSIMDIHSRGKLPVICGGSISLTNPLLKHPFILRQKMLVVCLRAQAELTSSLTGERIDGMLREGLLEEVKHLYELEHLHDVGADTEPKGVWKSIGYKELRPCVAHAADTNIDDLMKSGLEAMKSNTRQYAALQLKNLRGNILRTLRKRKITTITMEVKSKVGFVSQVQEPVLSRCQTWIEKQKITFGTGIASPKKAARRVGPSKRKRHGAALAIPDTIHERTVSPNPAGCAAETGMLSDRGGRGWLQSRKRQRFTSAPCV